MYRTWACGPVKQEMLSTVISVTTTSCDSDEKVEKFTKQSPSTRGGSPKPPGFRFWGFGQGNRMGVKVARERMMMVLVGPGRWWRRGIEGKDDDDSDVLILVTTWHKYRFKLLSTTRWGTKEKDRVYETRSWDAGWLYRRRSVQPGSVPRDLAHRHPVGQVAGRCPVDLGDSFLRDV